MCDLHAGRRRGNEMANKVRCLSRAAIRVSRGNAICSRNRYIGALTVAEFCSFKTTLNNELWTSRWPL